MGNKLKILIAIFGCNKAPYPDLIQHAKKTWASVHHNGETIFFYGTDEYYNLWQDNDLFLQVSDDYDLQHVKYAAMLDYMWDIEWDFVFRGSVSSYIDIPRLYEIAETLPLKGTYAGVDGGGFASGCGHFQSRDVADIVRKNTPINRIDSEDVWTGSLLASKGIKVTQMPRVEYNYDTHKIERCFHYRCKHPSDMLKQKEAFTNIFNELCF